MKFLYILIVFIFSTMHISAFGDVSSSQEHVAKLKSSGIENAGDPKIRELYQKLNDQLNELRGIEQQYQDSLQENAQAMKDKEQSTANKLLGGASMAATGVGGMMLAQSMAEQGADADAEVDMKAYLETFVCKYADGKSFKGGTENIELPGGNDLLPLYTEYVNLANDLKIRKEALGMRPGIESEKILDNATSGLYDDVALGKTGGAYASLARALQDPEGEDAKMWAEQKDKTKKNLTIGASVGGVGAVGGVVGNAIINKDAPKENSAKIKTEYEHKKRNQESEISKTESALNSAIADNKKRIDKYNDQVSQHQQFAQTITEPDCIKKFTEYTTYVKGLTTITDEFSDTSNLSIEYDLKEQKSAYEKCVKAAQELAQKIQKCESKPHHKWESNKCVDKTPVAPATIQQNGNKVLHSAPKPNQETTAAPASNPATNGNANNGKPTSTTQAQPSKPTTDTTTKQKTDTQTPAAPGQTNKSQDMCPKDNPRMTSLTDKNYVGQLCKYGNVSQGRVFKRKDGTCSCTAVACHPGYIVEQGICKPDPQIEMQKKIENLKYYDVCNKKQTNNDVCDKETFNWVNVGRLQAVGLIEEYVRIRHNDTVHCNVSDVDTSWNDDYIKCSSLKQTKYYEFKFDDVKESVDADLQNGVILGICNIHNVSSNIVRPQNALTAIAGGASIYIINSIANAANDAKGCKSKCTSELTATAQHMGLTVKQNGDWCVLSGHSISAKDAESQLAKIDGIDNYVFFHGIQIQGSQNVIVQLRQHIDSLGIPVRTFDCTRNIYEIKNSWYVGDDDVLRCTLNDKPIDFVFDDFSESWLYTQEVGESKMQCIISGGKFAGQECYGLTEQQCWDANATFKKQNPGASGFQWDGTNCISLDANEGQIYDIAVQIGVGAVGVIDCAVGTHTIGCALFMVEVAGLTAELSAGVAIENRAGEFLTVSTRCHERSCAIETLKDAGDVLSVMGALDETSANSVDTELARLVDYLEPADLPDVSGNDWNEVVEALGGDPEDAWGTALVWIQRIGLFAQFASIGTSGLRLTSKALSKLAGKGTRVGRAAIKVADSLDTAQDLTKIGRTANAADDAADAGRAANNASDAAKGADDAASAADDANDAAKAADNTSNSIPKSRDPNQGIGAAELLKNGELDTAVLDDLIASGEDVIYINRYDMGGNIRQITKRLSDAGYTMDASGGGDIIKFTKQAKQASSTADDAADAGRAANNASDAAKGADDAGRAADDAADVAAVMRSENMQPIPGYRAYKSPVLTENDATALMNRLQNQGYAVISVPANSQLEDVYRVVAMSKDDVARLNANIINGSAYRHIDNSANMNRLRTIADGRELGRVNGLKISIDSMADFGSQAGRPIIMVRVGNRKLPFYASSGMAGKMDVPTGKWEFFGGIGSKGWFNKGGLNDIVSHYNSAELRTIANILDSQIGDLRNSELVLESIVRQSDGGIGSVAALVDAPQISVADINRYLKYTPAPHSRYSGNEFWYNLDEIKTYLKNGAH